jgi:hypothetical protein
MSDRYYVRDADGPVRAPAASGTQLYLDLFVPPQQPADEAGGWLRPVRQTLARWTLPPHFLLARARAGGWQYSRQGLGTGAATPLEPADFDRRLARGVRAFPWLAVLLGVLAVVWLVGLVRDFRLAPTLLRTVLVGVIAAAGWLVHARWWRLHVGYDTDREGRARLRAAWNALRELRHCRGLWACNRPEPDPACLSRPGAPVVSRGIPKVRTSLPVPALVCGDKAAYFLPDKVLVTDGSRVRFVGHAGVTVGCDHVEMTVEDAGRYSDAEVVGRRWKYTFPDGRPRPGPGDNRELPVLRLGRLRLDVGETRFWLLTSDPRAPERFREHLFSTPAGQEDAGDLAERLADVSRKLSALGAGVRSGAAPLGALLRRVPARGWLAAVLVLVLAACVAVAVWTLGSEGRELAVADQLWEDGDRAGAVRLYVQYPRHFWRSGEAGPRDLRRVIECNLDRGDVAEARTWIERAVEHNVALEFNRDEARRIYAELKAQHDRRLAEEEAGRRERELGAEQERRRPQEEEEEQRREAERKAAAQQEEKDRAMMQEAKRRRELEKERQKEREAEQARRRQEQADAERRAELERREAKAAANVRYARDLIDRGMLEKGVQRLREVTREFPGTPSAQKAREMLRELGER